MIASLRGIVIEKTLETVVIECAGVGYEVFVTPNTNAQLLRGEEAFVYVEHIVRESDERLFGFIDADDRRMFRAIQTVSGIGPRIANAALAVYSGAELSQAIQDGDAKKVQQIPGVGKKSAERICLELKDKISQEIPGTVPATAVVQPALETTVITTQVVEALLGLGFNEKQAETAVATAVAAHPEADASNLLSAALKTIGK